MHQLVLIRHGESIWNQEDKFTGWTDVDLTEKGIQEAKQAGRFLQQKGYELDQAYTSVLKRAIRTLWLTLDEMDRMWLPVTRSWRLNERHYGALQGVSKEKMREEHGKEQVHQWRRSFSVRPPALEPQDERHPRYDPRYRDLNAEQLPSSESLADTVDRFLPFWKESIVPQLQTGKRILIAAHGNSLRALVKHLDQISDDEIPHINIPTGVPLIYELNEKLVPRQSFYLKDEFN